ncbi:phosphoribosylamine--glycine ligase [Candidatus Uhrbacteria bacterium]|nr:phosphoribosylamine--glycine ligase [Candidatus Uhrbacteria bacterium]
MTKKILVIGGGGREHALLWKLRQTTGAKLYAGPGNPGIAGIAENVAVDPGDVAWWANFGVRHGIDLTIVGPDAPLSIGIVDAFHSRGLRIFGPTRAAAKLEWSKAFAKEFMAAEGIPTAAFRVFDEFEAALRYVRRQGAPIVVKASGLALGKGVFVCATQAEAEAALRAILVEGRFGESGREVVVEEFLDGPELSVHALCDGATFRLLPFCRDYKRRNDGNQGPMTGGMGSVALPAARVLGDIRWQVVRILDQTLAGMAKRGTPFVGCLYPGIKLTSKGVRVLEYNARFGDPETQSLVRVIGGEFPELLERCVEGTLAEAPPYPTTGFGACVVIAARAYPESRTAAKRIFGLDAAVDNGAQVFHAGTRIVDGTLCAQGGRILGATGAAPKLETALDQAYHAAARIHFDGHYYRRDIGADLRVGTLCRALRPSFFARKKDAKASGYL